MRATVYNILTTILLGAFFLMLPAAIAFLMAAFVGWRTPSRKRRFLWCAVLFAAAKDWSVSVELKSFRAACEGRLRSTSPEGVLTELQENWLRWVDQVIEETNPLSAGLLQRLEQPVIE